jgi:hypothetical protein
LRYFLSLHECDPVGLFTKGLVVSSVANGNSERSSVFNVIVGQCHVAGTVA